MLEILYYVDIASGKSPIRDEIEKIKKESVKAKIKALIVHVAQLNGTAKTIVSKNIRGYHFSEIRIKFSVNLYRILYIVWQSDKMILLHIFVKKEGEQTPEKELIEAERRYQNFIKNNKLYL